jgi:DNA-binding MarR family transcriptional regulator
MEMEHWKKTDFEAVATLFQGLAHEVRLSLLFGIHQNKSLNEISEFMDITRGAMQDHIEKLISSDLLYRPEKSEKTYALTPFGEFFLDFLLRNERRLTEAISQLESEEDNVRNVVNEARNKVNKADVPVSDKDWDRKIHSKKWEEAWNETEQILEEK